MGIPAWFDGDPLEVSRRAHVFIRTIDHQYVHNKQFFGVAERFSVPDRCQDVSSFIILIWILFMVTGRSQVSVPWLFSRFQCLKFPLVRLSLTPSES